jgi:hypothetical protein
MYRHQTEVENMLIQEIYDHPNTREVLLENSSFITLFNRLDNNFEFHPHYDFDEEELDNDKLKIYQHLYTYIDGNRYIDIHSLEFDGRKFGLIGMAGRGGTDEEFSYITDVDTYRKCYMYIANEILKDRVFNPMDSYEDIGSDRFYGKSINSHFNRPEDDEYNDKLLRLHVSNIAQSIILGADPATAINESNWIKQPYKNYWIENINDIDSLSKINVDIFQIIAEETTKLRIE